MRRYLLLLGLTALSPAFGWTLSAGDAAGWDPRHISVRASADRCGFTEETLAAALDRALEVWNDVPTADVRIHRSPEPPPVVAAGYLADPIVGMPVILCDPDFAKAQGVDPYSVPAATRLWTVDERLAKGGIFLNAQDRAGAQVQYLPLDELVVILAHELGHLIGLGHSSSPAALMYYSIAGKTSPALTDDDRDAVTYLYPRNELAGGAFGCNAVHLPRTEVPWTALVAIAALWAATIALGRGVVRAARLP